MNAAQTLRPLVNPLLVIWLASVFIVHAQAADQREIDGVLAKFNSLRPTATDLAIYDLDWAPTLEAAQARAAKDLRPVLLVAVANSFGNLWSGHC